jgi:ADP-heptose:LPS heptosyltransferase
MKVLLCHRLNLGDLVCASPGIQWLHAQGARIRLLTNDFAARVGALLPGVEHVYAYRKFGQTAGREWRALLAAWAWRPQRVLGLSPSPDPRLSIRTVLLGGRIHRPQVRGTHVAEQLASILGWSGLEPLPPARLCLPATVAVKRDVAILVAARKPSNRPTPGQLVEIIRLLRSHEPNLVIEVFGLPASTASAAHLPDVVTQRDLQAGLQGMGMQVQAPSLEQLFIELAASASVIAPDGGATHIAAAFGKPVVALFGQLDIEAWRPYTPLTKTLQASSRRVADIPPEEVLKAWMAVQQAAATGATSAPALGNTHT